MSQPPGTIWDRLLVALQESPQGPSPASSRSPRPGLLDLTRTCPRLRSGVRIVPLAAGEGFLVEGPDGACCVATPDQAHIVERLDGRTTLIELLYHDMGLRGSLAPDRFGGLLASLSARGLLEGAGGRVFERLEAALCRRTRAGRLAALARRMARVRLCRVTLPRLVGLRPLPVLPAAIMATLGAIAIVPLLVMLSQPTLDLFVWRGSYPGGLLVLVASLVVFVLVRSVLEAVLVNGMVRGCPAAVELVLGALVLRVGDSGLARAGRWGRVRAWLTVMGIGGALQLVLTVAALTLRTHLAGVDGPAGGAAGPMGLLLELIPKAALASSAVGLYDICPISWGALHAVAREVLGVDRLALRIGTFLWTKLPSKVLAGGSPTPQERPYVLLAIGSVAWAAIVLVLGGRMVRVALVPMVARAVGTSSVLEAVLLGGFALSVLVPIALAVVSVLAFVAGRVAVAASRLRIWRHGRVLAAAGIPMCIIIASAPVLLPAPLGARVQHVLAGTFWAGAAAMAWIAGRRLSGSRLGTGMAYMAAAWSSVLLALPSLARRLRAWDVPVVPLRLPVGGTTSFGLDDALTDLATPFANLGVLLLFPFFLFTFVRPAGRWLAVAGLIGPFLVTARSLGGGSDVFFTPYGITYLSVAATFGFALLAGVALVGFGGSPLAVFWLFESGSLTMLGLSRVPEMLAMGGYRESAAFTGTTTVLAAAMALVGLVSLVLTLMEPPVGEVDAGARDRTDEGQILLHGFAAVVNAVLSGTRAVFGATREGVLVEVVSQNLAARSLPLAMVGRRAEPTTVGKVPTPAEASGPLGEVAAQLLASARTLVGAPFVARSLVLVHDRISWVERELLGYYVFREGRWAQGVIGLAGPPRQDRRLRLLASIPLFSGLGEGQLARLALHMRARRYEPRDVVVRQGEKGQEFFVVVAGRAQVLTEDASGLAEHVATLGPSDCFGEVALLSDVGRTATVKAVEPLLCLTLSATDFREAFAQGEVPERLVPLIRFGSFLSRIPLLGDFSHAQLVDLVGRLEEERFRAGQDVVRQGEPGERFYIVREGELAVLRDGQEVGRLSGGDHFGEIALVSSSPRTATVQARTEAILLSLSRGDFFRVLSGHLSALRSIEQFAHRRLYQLSRVASHTHGDEGAA